MNPRKSIPTPKTHDGVVGLGSVDRSFDHMVQLICDDHIFRQLRHFRQTNALVAGGTRDVGNSCRQLGRQSLFGETRRVGALRQHTP